MTPYSPYKGKSGIKRIFNATGYSLAGFKAAFSHEAAFRQVLLLNLILIPISFFVHVSALNKHSWLLFAYSQSLLNYLILRLKL
jgi:diacylglycerol kinase (ATP)